MPQCHRCSKEIPLGRRTRRWGENREIYCDYCGKCVAREAKKRQREALKQDHSRLFCKIESSLEKIKYAPVGSITERVDHVKQLLEELKEIEKQIDS